MADLAAWNDSDDDEPRRKKPHVDESALEREVFGEDESDAESNNISNEDAPAWRDDEDIRVDLRSASRLKKLRQAPTDRVLKGAALEERLRARFKATKGPQDWATASKPNPPPFCIALANRESKKNLRTCEGAATQMRDGGNRARFMSS